MSQLSFAALFQDIESDLLQDLSCLSLQCSDAEAESDSSKPARLPHTIAPTPVPSLPSHQVCDRDADEGVASLAAALARGDSAAVERLGMELARLARRGDLDAARRIAAAPEPTTPPTALADDNSGSPTHRTESDYSTPPTRPAAAAAVSAGKATGRSPRVSFSRYITTVRTSPLSISYETVRFTPPPPPGRSAISESLVRSLRPVS